MLILRMILGVVAGAACGWGAGLVLCIPLAIVLNFVDFANHGDAVWAAAWHSSKSISFQWLPVLGAIIGLIVPIVEEINKANEATKLRQAAEAARKAEELACLQRHIGEQQEYRNQIVVLGEQSISHFESLPKHLIAAEKYFDRAETDFADGAFAPFWDSIENAAKCLGRFDEGVQHIKNNSSRYTNLIKKYEDAPPQFPLAQKSVAKLNVGTATSKRMKPIVRTAQRDFHFASIYEQRKTNQILVAGFTNLAQALDRMTSQITASIDDLVGSVEVMTSTQNAIYSRMGDAVERASQHHNELMEKASEGADRERRALEMLDNIQRGRRPSP